ncbi:nuclear protein-like family protein [Cardiosporidium cionae]|uniref:Nuclear protein-like family protein n=1 Tax=Cardiosporidium cionae TaxID=476202 RepID=A0ABQ7J8Z3_9APIC|nr:nuclear protein-like family protein [Cardiosporidium cionae]|eukprot:KAF8820464.1 nuclear protein-like family protein [Cardiosporidium cionae]
MSSLAAARADGFYYGPNFNPQKHKSLNKYRNSHPLGERAKDIGIGILIVRFEMPFKVWCLGCDSIIDKGVRFNAKKRCIGHYFSTKILEFSMNCYGCNEELIITTDPKSSQYICSRGLREKVEAFDSKDAETIALDTEDNRERARRDAMYKLEKKADVTDSCSSAKRVLKDLYKLQHSRSSDSYSTNAVLRKSFRIQKKLAIEKEMEEQKPKNFALPITTSAHEESADQRSAARVKFRSDTPLAKLKARRLKVMRSSIFTENKKDSNPIKTGCGKRKRSIFQAT